MRFRERNNNGRWEDFKQESYDRDSIRNNFRSISEEQNVANTNKIGLSTEMENGKLEWKRFAECNEVNMWNSFPTKPPICGGDDGIPRELDSITFPKWRNESIKAYGNAIVPQVVYEIFKAIEKFEEIV